MGLNAAGKVGFLGNINKLGIVTNDLGHISILLLNLDRHALLTQTLVEHRGSGINKVEFLLELGGVMVGDDCEIGANTTIDRGALGDTVLEEDVRLDNQIQIGHNVRIGAHTAIAGCAAIAGSTKVGRYCLIAGGAGIIGHLEIADRVTVGAMSLVTHDLREAGEYVSGTPIQPKREWRKNAARFGQLDQLARRLRKLGDKNDD